MGLRDKLQLARLVALLLRPGEAGAADAKVLEECAAAPGGGRFDLYRPRGGRSRGALVAVHGGERTGWKNARLVRLARALARCGVTCAVPELAGLARCSFDRADLDALEAVCLEAGRLAGSRPGLLGFSYGAGYALSAAAREGLAAQLRFVVAVGAFHDLPGLLDWYAAQGDVEPRTALEWDDAVYLRLILAWWFRGPLGLDPTLCAEMESLLDRFCEQASEAEKRAFYERSLRQLDLFPTAARTLDRALLADLSPKGRAERIRCPVTLIHDRYDGIVPLREAQRLHQEIAGSRLVVTEVLSHVTPARALDVLALARLTGALAPLVSAG
ncbi:MAG TPA: alpha/beta hydrolase [Myxococcales bacterium]|jgi:pimeloyl-ACP methyl ester carboxylesterase